MSWIAEQNVVWAIHVHDDLKKRGLDADGALKACGLRATSLAKAESMIPYDKHCALLGVAARMTGEDCYGLALGARMHPRDAGLLGYIGLSSSTLRDCFENIIRYTKVMANFVDIRLVNDGEYSILEQTIDVRTMPEGYDQEAEFSIALFIQACRVLTGKQICPAEVHFMHQRSHNLGTVRRVLGCEVYYGADRERMVFRRHHLSLPIISADDKLLVILRDYADAILEERSRFGPDFKHQVERLIVHLLPRGEATIENVASDLGMSKRTLSRRLAGQGLTFTSLLAGIRGELSLKYLAERSISTKETAFLLGYSDVSAYSRAFKRWTGQTPARMRN